MHTNTCAGALDERLRKLLADIARPVDVGLKRDRSPRPANRLEHRRENLIAILQGFDAIARNDRGPEQHAHFAPELRVEDVVVTRDPVLRLLFRLSEIEHEDHDDQRTDHRPSDCPEWQVTSSKRGFNRTLTRGRWGLGEDCRFGSEDADTRGSIDLLVVWGAKRVMGALASRTVTPERTAELLAFLS